MAQTIYDCFDCGRPTAKEFGLCERCESEAERQIQNLRLLRVKEDARRLRAAIKATVEPRMDWSAVK